MLSRAHCSLSLFRVVSATDFYVCTCCVCVCARTRGTVTNAHTAIAPVPDLYLPENISEIAALDETPERMSERKVTIEHDTKSSMMNSGIVGGWKLTWDEQERWHNPLTGWTGSADPMLKMTLWFDTKEDAIAYAEKKGNHAITLHTCCVVYARELVLTPTSFLCTSPGLRSD